jgi:hypothetical protein
MGVWIESKYKPEYCQVAVDILSRGKSLAAICAHLNICRDTLYAWRDAHPDFAASLKAGLQKSQAVWEDLGEQGIKGDIEKFGAAPWIFTMKNRFRDHYKEDKEQKTVSESMVEKMLDKLVD